VPVRTTEQLREQHFGVLQGRRFSELSDAELAAIDACDADPHRPFDGGESYAAMHARVVRLLEDLLTAPTDADVLLVTHAGPMRCVGEYARGLPVGALARVKVPNGVVESWRLGLS
jgi:broad specificity phosphatase PhoE